jgi:2-isopropylmalate synthase
MKHMESSAGERYEVPYLPVDPADVGRAYEPVIRINSQSGKSGVAHVLERDHGYRVPRALAVELSQAVQLVADARGEELSAQDVVTLFERQYFDAPGPVALQNVDVQRSHDRNECTVVARFVVRGEQREARGIGKGPVEAFVAALNTLSGPVCELTDYAEHAAAPSASACAVAYVAVRFGQSQRYGAGRHEDVVVAAFRAIVSAYNRAHAEVAGARG